MKLYRVKQGRQRGSRGYFNKRYVFRNDLSSVWRERLPASYHVCCLSLHDSKAQLQYLRSPNTTVRTFVVSVVILLIGVETSPISRFYNRGDQQRPWLQSLHFATSEGDAQYVSS